MVAGERELLDAIWAYSVLHGATPSPFDALNALRGLRTLAVRTNQQAATALRAGRGAVASIPAVTAVHYPGLASHPQFDLAKRQMRNGGTVLAIDLAGGRDAAAALLSTRCAWPAWRRRSAARRRWCAIRRRRRTPA